MGLYRRADGNGGDSVLPPTGNDRALGPSLGERAGEFFPLVELKSKRLNFSLQIFGQPDHLGVWGPF